MTPESWRTWFTRSCATHPGSTQPGAAYRLGRAILNTVVEDGMIRANPARVKGAGREQSPERPIAAPDEVLKIVKAIDQRYEAMVLLAAWCSLRFAELAGLRRNRVDLLHRTIRVEENGVELSSGRVVIGAPKTDAGRRTVSIPSELVPAMERHLANFVGVQTDALVFTSPEGHPLRRTKFRNRWMRLARLQGLPDSISTTFVAQGRRGRPMEAPPWPS